MSPGHLGGILVRGKSCKPEMCVEEKCGGRVHSLTILHFIRRLTFAAPQFRLTLLAHQAGLFSSIRVIQHVLVEFEVAECSEALLTLVIVVFANRVASLFAAWAHEVSITIAMFLNRICVPRSCIKDFSAG